MFSKTVLKTLKGSRKNQFFNDTNSLVVPPFEENGISMLGMFFFSHFSAIEIIVSDNKKIIRH